MVSEASDRSCLSFPSRKIVNHIEAQADLLARTYAYANFASAIGD